MKKLITTASLLMGLVVASPSWALMISGTLTDVGNIDGFLYNDTVANNGAAQKAWVDSIIGGDNTLTYYDSSTVGGSAFWADTTLSGVYAYKFNNNAEPAYYFLNIDSGSQTNSDLYLFHNVDNMNYAVVNFNVFGGSQNFEFGSIASLAGYGGSSGTPVPEPSGAALMGLGLLMIGVISRRRKQQA